MLFNHDSGLIQSILTIDTSVAPALGGSNSLQIVGTGGLVLPVGTTAQRPTGVKGMQRFNSTSNQLEYFDGTVWIQGVDGTVTSVTVESDNAALVVTNGTVTDAGTITLSLDQTLVNLAASVAPASGGPVVRLANDTFISREFVGTAPVTVTNGDGVAGNPTVSVNGELSGLSTLGTIGGVFRTAAGTYTTKTFAKAGDITVTEDATSITIGYTASGDLAALGAAGTGIIVKTAAGVYAGKSVDVSGTGLSITNADGVGGNPTITYTPSANAVQVNALSTAGYVTRQADGSWVTHSITGSTDTTTGSIVVTDGGSVTGTSISFTPGVELARLAALTAVGIVTRDANGVYAGRSLTGSTSTAGNITITNADGIAGNVAVTFTAGTEVAGIAALAGNGLVTRTAAGTYVGRAISSANSYITITNGDGVSAAPELTFVPGTNLAALSTTTVTGLLSRDSAGALTGKSIIGSGSVSVSEANNVITVSYTAGANLGAINALATTGMVAYNATSGAFSGLTIAGTTDNIVVTNGDGKLGAPTVDLAAVTQASSGTFSKVTLDGFGRVVGNTAVTTADITALVDATYVNASGDGMTGNLSFNGLATVTGLVSPTSASDAATKNYVDSTVSGLSWKQAVDTAGTVNPINAAAGARFLNLTDGKIYTATAADTWNAGVAATDGDAVFDRATETGYVYSGTAWTQFTGTGQIAAGVGLAKVGNQIDVKLGAGIAQLPTDEVGLDLATPTSGGLRLRLAGADSTDTAAQLTLVTGAGLTQDATGLYIAAGGIANAQLANSTVTISANSGTADAVALGETLAITGSGAISTAVTDNALAISVATATDTVLGVAKFSATDFTVASGAVSLVGKSIDAATDVTIGSLSNGDLLVYNTSTSQWENKTQSSIVPAIGIDALTDVVITSAALNNVLQFNGTNWVNKTVADAGLQAVDAGLNSLAALTGPGFVTVSTDGNTFTSRTLVAGAGVSISTLDGSANPTIANTGVLSVATAGTGVSAAFVDGVVTLTGNAVTAVTSGSGISASITAGNLSVANTGVLALTSTDARLTVGTMAAGSIELTNNAVYDVTAGSGVSVTGSKLAGYSVANTGVVALTGTANQVTVGNTGTSYTVGLPASVTIDTALTVTGLGADKVLRTGAAGVVEGVALTNGQFLIGATGAAPAAASITAGTGVTVTNSANGITIALSGGAAAVTSVTGAVAVGSTTALSVTNTGTAQAPVITYGVDAGLESLAALSTTGIVVQSAANTFVTRALTAGTGVSITGDVTTGDLTIANTGVTSVGLDLPSIFGVTGSPVTTAGTLTATLTSQAVASVFAGPVSGSSAAPTFRALAYSDLPIALYTEDTTAKTVVLTANEVSHASGNFAAAGDASAVEFVLRNTTSNATATELFVDGSAVRAALPTNGAWTFTVQVVGRGTGVSAGYRFDGIIVKDADNSSTAFIGVPSKNVLGETSEALDAAVAADATNGSLKIAVTGAASASMKWVATIRATQVIG
jgi:hypothetical protein